MAHDDWGRGQWHRVPSDALRTAADASWAGSRILVVAEDLVYCQREIVPPLLDAQLVTETTTAAGPELVSLLALPFELVLLDIASKHGPGYQACVQVRNACSLPLLLVLHGAARDEAWNFYQAGADAHIVAPFDRRELLARLYALLRRQPARHRFV